MKTEMQYKELSSRTIQSNAKSGQFNFKDNRPLATAQARLINGIRNNETNQSVSPIQRMLSISSSPARSFQQLSHKQYRSLKKRMELPIESWLLLKKMAASEETFRFDNWKTAIRQAPAIGQTNPLILAQTVYGLREDITKDKKDKERNKKILPALIMAYNHGKKAPGTKPQFKSPETEANKLLMFNDLKDETLLQNFEIENAAEGKKEMYAMGGFVENVFTEWAEDHLNDFGQDTYSTNLPIFDYIELRERIQTARTERGSQITALSNTSTSNIVPEKADKHLFLRSVIDGGNMLPAPQFAIIGKDSLLATEVQNGISEEEAKQLIADEYGYKSENLCFVEQPDYHIDLMIMLLGGNKVMIKPNSNDIQLTNTTIRDLKDFKHPPLEVQVDEEELAGKQTADKKWEYNFFNGEYVKGKDNELYYITNGTTNDEAQEKFKTFMLKETGVKDVIFSPSINSNLLNETKGGAGCRFKGAKSS